MQNLNSYINCKYTEKNDKTVYCKEYYEMVFDIFVPK